MADHYRPLMDGKSTPNVYDEHLFSMQLAFGASTTLTYLGKDVTVTRPTSTTLLVTFAQPYVRVTSGAPSKCCWQRSTRHCRLLA